MKVGNPVCDQCLASHPPAFDCTTHFVAPDTPTVTPLVDEAYAAVMVELERQQIAGEATEISGLANWHSIIRVILAALRPVEADDAGLIERELLEFADKVMHEPASAAMRKAADALASLSAAKVEAEKEVERFNERLLREMQVLLRIADKSPFWNKDASNGALGMAEHLCAVFGIEPAALKGRAQGDGE